MGMEKIATIVCMDNRQPGSYHIFRLAIIFQAVSWRTKQQPSFGKPMTTHDSADITRKNMLIFSFVFVVLCTCIFSGMGYYYLTYRNTLMQDALIKSGKMSVWMLVHNLERDIISQENKMILDVAFQQVQRLDRETLTGIKRNHPAIDKLFFYPRQDLTGSKREQDFDTEEGWLAQNLEAENLRAPIAPLTLRHFSGSFNTTVIQAGFISLPPASPEAVPEFLLFTLDLDYIRSALLPETSDRSLSDVAITERNFLETDDLTDKDMIFVDAPFQDILPFWKAVARLDTSDMHKRARMEFFVYSGIILIVFFLIVLSIYFIWGQMQQERKLSQVKSEMISHISHELKTPLSLIRMYSETLMLGRISQPAKIQHYYQIILSECDRLHLLIINTLDFSSIKKGMKEYNFSKGDIAEAVQNMITSYSYYLKQHGFIFHADIDSEIPPFSFDKIAMNQIIGNLLDNAMKFSPEKKEIALTLTRKQNNLILEVSDHGIGIQPEALDAVFEPYYRLSDQVRGSGIALSLVRHAVLAHHGSIRVRSQEGSGSTFVITFPLPENDNAIEG